MICTLSWLKRRFVLDWKSIWILCQPAVKEICIYRIAFVPSGERQELVSGNGKQKRNRKPRSCQLHRETSLDIRLNIQWYIRYKYGRTMHTHKLYAIYAWDLVYAPHAFMLHICVLNDVKGIFCIFKISIQAHMNHQTLLNIFLASLYGLHQQPPYIVKRNPLSQTTCTMCTCVNFPYFTTHLLPTTKGTQIIGTKLSPPYSSPTFHPPIQESTTIQTAMHFKCAYVFVCINVYMYFQWAALWRHRDAFSRLTRYSLALTEFSRIDDGAP